MKPYYFLTYSSRQLRLEGVWTLLHLSRIKKQFKKIKLPSDGEIVLTGDAIKELDSAGAWFIQHMIKKLTEKNLNVQVRGMSTAHQTLLSLIENHPAQKVKPVKNLKGISKLGYQTLSQLKEIQEYLQFIGKLSIEGLRMLRLTKHIRWNSIVSTIERSGYQALPIIGLLAFMIGIVLTYQMGNQLRKYGADVFIVNLLGFSVLREFGPLLTAILVAGRTGSAFTAQLGMMQINQEIDALNTMGVTSEEILLIPRLMGLLIALPLLTIWADIFGVVGGMFMANNILDLTWYHFLSRFEQEIPVSALLIGLIKAPVFALIIGSIGCFEGMKVQGSADQVGLRTTRSVVLAIFFIIVADAIFAFVFSHFNL